MDLEIVSHGKQEIVLRTTNVTVAEIVRNYLNQQGVDFVAWRREHPSKPIEMRIQVTDGTVKKSVSEAVAAIKKDLDALVASIKK